jgi:preprotein translocase SecE subunit
MGTLMQDKNGNDASKPPGDEPDDSGDDAQERERPVRPARRPPNMPSAGPAASIAAGAPSDGFFHIRKRGQGYWTRMGTAAGAALVGALMLNFIFSERDSFNLSAGWAEALCGLFAVTYGLGVFYFMNRQTSVDFLIATDSEMKKVNWTSRKELMGSTKVVIIFMFVIAAYLFIMDIVFGYFFYAIGVVKTPPI